MPSMEGWDVRTMSLRTTAAVLFATARHTFLVLGELVVDADVWRWGVGIDASRRRILASFPLVPAVLGGWLMAWALQSARDDKGSRWRRPGLRH